MREQVSYQQEIDKICRLAGYSGDDIIELAAAISDIINSGKDTYSELRDATQQLSEFLQSCNALYRTSGRSQISDQEYDALELAFNALLDADQSLQEFRYSDLDFNLTHSKKAPHSTPMLSLEKAYSAEEINKFITRVQRFFVNNTSVVFVGELKIDGLAFAAMYKDGHYVKGITRGDGYVGEDMTQQIGKIVPATIDVHDTIEIRGEIFITHKDFQEINSSLPSAERFSTARNLAAGSFRLLDVRAFSSRKLHYFSYAALSHSPTHALPQSHHELMQFLERVGFSINKYCTILHDAKEIERYYERMTSLRSDLPYDTDGIVIKINNISLQERIGNTKEHPRWAIAYKFQNERKGTKVLDITIQVGRTGAITPVAVLEPVIINGVVIRRATLHNFVDMMKKDVHIGDYVVIERAGDVIPQVISVDLQMRRPNSRPFEVPVLCPECSSVLIKGEDDVIVRCPSSLVCPAQLLARLVHFAGRGAMNIDGLGAGQLKQLWDLELVRKPSDIFFIQKEQIENLPGWGKKSAANLISSIEKARYVPLERFIYALSIRHVGKDIAGVLARRCINFNVFCDLASEKAQAFGEVEGIGPKVVQSLSEFFSTRDNISEIGRLLKRINVLDCVSKINKSSEFYGKSIVFTGKLNSVSRDEAKERAIKLGAQVKSAVNSQTDFVVVGSDAGSKLKKARELGITILDEEEWLQRTHGSL